MKLATWLTDNKISQAAFANMVGSSQPQVARYVAGSRIPNRSVMARIITATDGAVQAADFYETVPEPAEGAA